MKEVNILKYEPHKGTVLFFEKTCDGVINGLEFLNSKKKKVYFPKYELAPFSCGLSLITVINDPVNYLTINGNLLFKQNVNLAHNFSENRTFIIENDEVILIDTLGNKIKHFSEEYLPYYFNQGLALMMKMAAGGDGVTSGYVDYNGDFIIPPIIEETLESPLDVLDPDDYYWEGLIRYKQNGLYGFIDKDINIIIPTIYEDASRFYNELSAVKLEGKYGYINKQNEFIIKPKYDYASAFFDNYAVIEMNNKSSLIDKNEKIILTPECDYIVSHNNKEIMINKNGKYGLIGYNENEILPPIFNHLHGFNQGLSMFDCEGISGLIDRNENILIMSNTNN